MEDDIIAVVVLLIAIGLYLGISVKSILNNQREIKKALDEVLENVRSK